MDEGSDVMVAGISPDASPSSYVNNTETLKKQAQNIQFRRILLLIHSVTRRLTLMLLLLPMAMTRTVAHKNG